MTLLQRDDVVLHEVGHHRLRQVRVGRGEERAEVLRVGHQVVHGLVLLGVVAAGHGRPCSRRRSRCGAATAAGTPPRRPCRTRSRSPGRWPPSWRRARPPRALNSASRPPSAAPVARGEVDVLAQCQVQRGAQAGGAGVDAPGNLSGNCLAMAPASGSAIISMWPTPTAAPRTRARGPGSLGVDDVLQRHHVVLDQLGHHALGQVRVGRAEEGAEVLRIGDRSLTALSCLARSLAATPVV